jgi:drug/metabolite transporter (DMT)-like permease
MVPLASSLVYRDRPRLYEAAGVLIATFGTVLMTLPAGGLDFSRGDILSFFCAVVFALHIVVISHFSPVLGFATISVVQVVTAAVLATGLFWFAEPVRFHLTPAVAAAVLVTGLLATALAFTTLTWAQQYTSATRAALIFALEPVVAWVTSWALTGEVLPDRGKAGAGLILSGILLVELKRTKTENHQRDRVATPDV